MALAERVEVARQSAAGVSLPPITRSVACRDVAIVVCAGAAVVHRSVGAGERGLQHSARGSSSRADYRVSALEQSLWELVRRHEVLRTSFVSQEGQPVQQMRPCEWRCRWLICVRLNADRAASAGGAIGARGSRRPFDLRQAPLLRAQLVQLSEARHEFLFTMHHIVSDGWSTGVLVREIGELYPSYLSGVPSPLPELAIQYADFAVWQREHLQGEVLDEELSYWKEQLADAPEVLELPADRPRPLLPELPRSAATIRHCLRVG